jgi:hypothetical protein
MKNFLEELTKLPKQQILRFYYKKTILKQKRSSYKNMRIHLKYAKYRASHLGFKVPPYLQATYTKQVLGDA